MPFSREAAFILTCHNRRKSRFFFFRSANWNDQAWRVASLAARNLDLRLHKKPFVCFNNLFLRLLAIVPRFTRGMTHFLNETSNSDCDVELLENCHPAVVLLM